MLSTLFFLILTCAVIIGSCNGSPWLPYCTDTINDTDSNPYRSPLKIENKMCNEEGECCKECVMLRNVEGYKNKKYRCKTLFQRINVTYNAEAVEQYTQALGCICVETKEQKLNVRTPANMDRKKRSIFR